MSILLADRWMFDALQCGLPFVDSTASEYFVPFRRFGGILRLIILVGIGASSGFPLFSLTSDLFHVAPKIRMQTRPSS